MPVSISTPQIGETIIKVGTDEKLIYQNRDQTDLMNVNSSNVNISKLLIGSYSDLEQASLNLHETENDAIVNGNFGVSGSLITNQLVIGDPIAKDNELGTGSKLKLLGDGETSLHVGNKTDKIEYKENGIFIESFLDPADNGFSGKIFFSENASKKDGFSFFYNGKETNVAPTGLNPISSNTPPSVVETNLSIIPKSNIRKRHDIASSIEGEYIVVWESDNGRIYFQRFLGKDLNTALDSEKVLVSLDSTGNTQPSVTYINDTGYVIAWSNTITGNIYFKAYNPNDKEIDIYTVTNSQNSITYKNPVISSVYNNKFYLEYEEHTLTEFTRKVSIFDVKIVSLNNTEYPFVPYTQRSIKFDTTNYLDGTIEVTSNVSVIGSFITNSNTSEQRHIYSHGDSGSYRNIYIQNGRLVAETNIGQNITSTKIVSDEEWYFFTVVFNSSGVVTMYINGELEISNTIEIPSYSNTLLTIGTNFDGNLDNIAVFNTILNNDEINKIYNSAYPRDAKTLVDMYTTSVIGAWNFNDIDIPLVPNLVNNTALTMNNVVYENKTLETFQNNSLNIILEQFSPINVSLTNTNIVTLWMSNNPEETNDIYMTLHDISGNVIISDTYIDVSNNNQRNPSISLLDNDMFIVCWESDHILSGTYNIYGKIFKNDGTVFIDRFKINPDTVTGSHVNCKVANIKSKGFIVVWEGYHESSGYNVVHQRRYKTPSKSYENTIGTPVLTPYIDFTTSSQNPNLYITGIFYKQRKPNVVILSDEKYSIVFYGNKANTNTIDTDWKAYQRRFYSNTTGFTFDVTESEIGIGSKNIDTSTSIGVFLCNNKNYGYVWKGNAGYAELYNRTIFLRINDEYGSSILPNVIEIDVSTGSGDDLLGSYTVITKDNLILVAWENINSVTVNETNIRGMWYDSAGNAVTSNEVLNGIIDGRQQYPYLSVNNNQIVLSYNSDYNLVGPSSFDIFTTILDTPDNFTSVDHYEKSHDNKRSIEFQGVNQFAVRLENNAEKLPDYNKNITVSLWFKSDNNSDTTKRCLISLGSASRGQQYRVYISNTTVYVKHNADQDEYSTNNFSFNLTNGMWHHLVVIWIPASKYIKVWIDGSMVSFFTNVLNMVSSVWITEQLYIGAEPKENLIVTSEYANTTEIDPITSFIGYIDEVSIWTDKTDDSFVKSLYNQGVYPDISTYLPSELSNNLYAWWSFDNLIYNNRYADKGPNGYSLMLSRFEYIIGDEVPTFTDIDISLNKFYQPYNDRIGITTNDGTFGYINKNDGSNNLILTFVDETATLINNLEIPIISGTVLDYEITGTDNGNFYVVWAEQVVTNFDVYVVKVSLTQILSSYMKINETTLTERPSISIIDVFDEGFAVTIDNFIRVYDKSFLPADDGITAIVSENPDSIWNISITKSIYGFIVSGTNLVNPTDTVVSLRAVPYSVNAFNSLQVIPANKVAFIGHEGSSTGKTVFVIDKNTGFMGINNNNPTAELDVKGSLRITGDLTVFREDENDTTPVVFGNLDVMQTLNVTNFHASNIDIDDIEIENTLYARSNIGRVGIKTSTPMYDLDVSGTGHFNKIRLGDVELVPNGDVVELVGGYINMETQVPLLNAIDVSATNIITNTIQTNSIHTDDISANELYGDLFSSNINSSNITVSNSLLVGTITADNDNIMKIGGNMLISQTLDVNDITTSTISVTNLDASSVTVVNIDTNEIVVDALHASMINSSNINIENRIDASSVFINEVTAINTFTTDLFTEDNIYTSNIYTSNVYTSNIYTPVLDASNINVDTLIGNQATVLDITNTILQTEEVFSSNIFSSNLSVENTILSEDVSSNTIHTNIATINTINAVEINSSIVYSDVSCNTINVNELIASNVNSTDGSMNNVHADNIYVTDISANTIESQDISSNEASISVLSSVDIHNDNLYSIDISSNNIDASTIYVSSFTGNYGSITDLSSSTISTDQITVNNVLFEASGNNILVCDSSMNNILLDEDPSGYRVRGMPDIQDTQSRTHYPKGYLSTIENFVVAGDIENNRFVLIPMLADGSGNGGSGITLPIPEGNELDERGNLLVVDEFGNGLKYGSIFPKRVRSDFLNVSGGSSSFEPTNEISGTFQYSQGYDWWIGIGWKLYNFESILYPSESGETYDLNSANVLESGDDMRDVNIRLYLETENQINTIGKYSILAPSIENINSTSKQDILSDLIYNVNVINPSSDIFRYKFISDYSTFGVPGIDQGSSPKLEYIHVSNANLKNSKFYYVECIRTYDQVPLYNSTIVSNLGSAETKNKYLVPVASNNRKNKAHVLNETQSGYILESNTNILYPEITFVRWFNDANSPKVDLCNYNELMEWRNKDTGEIDVSGVLNKFENIKNINMTDTVDWIHELYLNTYNYIKYARSYNYTSDSDYDDLVAKGVNYTNNKNNLDIDIKTNNNIVGNITIKFNISAFDWIS